MAFAFTLFISTIIAREANLLNVRRVRNGILAVAVILPLASFWVYQKSLPPGEPTNKAFWPALWIFMILLAVALGVSAALWKVRRKPHK